MPPDMPPDAEPIKEADKARSEYLKEQAEQIDQTFKSIDCIKEKMEKACNSITEVVVEMLKGSAPSKFAEASRVCQLGQQLQLMKGRGVSDFPDDNPGDMGLPAIEQYRYANQGVIGGVGGYYPRERPHQVRAGQMAGLDDVGNPLGLPDQHQVMRDLVPMLQGLIGDQKKSGKSLQATREAEELTSLTEYLDILRRSDNLLPEGVGTPANPARKVIEDRVAQLLKNIEKRNHEPEQPDQEQLRVVPADVPRGHQAGVRGQEDDNGPGLRADANGAGGHDAAPQEGAQGLGAGQALVR